jgi:2-furoate---CoA ligase
LHRLRPDRRGHLPGGERVNLALSLLAAVERHPQAEALPGITYAQLHERVARIAGGLALEPGERMAAVLDNRVETALLYWAAQWCGAVFVPLSWRSSDAELGYCIEDCGARLVFRESTPLPHGPPHAGVLDRDEREPSLMLYTSGTTGRPKGVARSHRADRAGGLSQALQHGYCFGDRTLGVMPLYHTMGVHSLIAMHMVGGCFVSQPSWDAEEALRLVQDERITSLYLAPTLYYDLVHHPRLDDYDVSSVETLAYAGAAMTSALVERCAQVFRPRLFVNHYGSTEIYSVTVHRDQAAKPGCAGRPSLNARLRLDENGEILCHTSSDEAFTGYWSRPDADEKAIREGWYHTGDVGRLDKDGDLWILGRVDDMINSGGENVHPLEVEDVLARHPKVTEVAVVAAPDERLGQRVVAVIVAEGELTAEELDAWCLASETLARFKRPREYRFVESLPKSASGKILRRLIREGAPTT